MNASRRSSDEKNTLRPAAPLEVFPIALTTNRRETTIVAITIVVAMLVLMIGTIVATSAYRGSVFPPILVSVFCIFGVLIAVGAIPRTRQRGKFRFLNATVMTHATRPTADSWVHLAPTRPAALSTSLAFAWFAVAAAGAAGVAFAQLAGLMPRIKETGSTGGLVIGLLVCVVMAVGSGWTAWVMFAQGARHRTFGRRPSGIALGRSGVSVRVPGRDAEIPWSAIATVEAMALPVGKGATIPVIRLQLTAGSNIPGDLQFIAVEGNTVPRDAVFTALRWYFMNPDSRWELSRSEGQRRLDEWCRGAIAGRDDIDSPDGARPLHR